MKLLNYQKLMKHDPTYLGEIINQLGQIIKFYEHPIKGDESCIIAVLHLEETACYTEFFDLENFYTNSDYNPIFKDGKWLSAFEL